MDKKEEIPSVPTRSQHFKMKAYVFVDQHRTRKELETETYSFPFMRERILAIGRKYRSHG